MKLQAKYAGLFGYIALGIAVATSGSMVSVPAHANGEEFFQPAGDGKVDTVYFGIIKDENGRPLDDAVLTIRAKNAGMTFPFQNDQPGHYRSPDIGAALKDLGETVDPSQTEIECAKAGYKMAHPVKVPSKTDGALQIDFVMVKDDTAKAAASR
jgi:hypothetical protein